MTKERLECERVIYKIFDILDPEGNNTEFWKQEFVKMNDSQFINYMKKDLPLYFQTGAFKEPTMEQIAEALDVIDCPLLERVYMPCTYKDENGNPMKTAECMVFPIPVKRMKQMVTKKNGMSTSINMRDERTGLLTGVDKNGKESDREFECLAISGLDNTMKELSRSRADSMGDKSVMYNTINVLGQVSLDELPDDPTDSLSKNLLNWYFLGAQLMTNLVNEDYYLPFTLKDKDVNKVTRQ